MRRRHPPAGRRSRAIIRLQKRLRTSWRDAPEPKIAELPRAEMPYRMAQLMAAPLASTAVRGLMDKSAHLQRVAELCAAGEEESGNMRCITKVLGKRPKERRFHSYFARSLPKITKIKLPFIMNKKKKIVVQKPCSALGMHMLIRFLAH